MNHVKNYCAEFFMMKRVTSCRSANLTRTPLRAEERDVVILELCSSQNTIGMELSHEQCVFHAPVFLSALRPRTLLFLLLLWEKEMERHVIMSHTSTYG